MNRNATGHDDSGLPIHERINVLGSPLVIAPVGPQGPTTGFFRNNFCDSSSQDPGSHTVAAVVTPTFLDFSKSRGNDLWSLFPRLRSQSSSPSSSSSTDPCVWCLCASRWAEALRLSSSHPQGESIVPRVVLEATHERALEAGGIAREELEMFAVGGDGTGRLAGGGGGGGAVPQTGGRVGGGERVGR
ncbi:hypothetical protein JCM8547_004709 [Rhodosporidiobolus lusitaniae]